jgi:chaperonin GroES
MLNLDTPLTLDDAAIKASNLCDRFSDTDLGRIGEECYAGYVADEQSREDWMRRNEAGMDLALQIQKVKTFPWANCANIAFPLVTIAAMQFHARAYPALINGNSIVKCDVKGSDPQGARVLQANKIAKHMSWQLLEQDECWEEQEDKAILNLSIVGTNFKKTYFSAALGHNVSELVLAKDLVLNYWSKSVTETPRKTHLIPRFKNEIYENVMSGIWRDVLDESWFESPPIAQDTTAKREQDARQGVAPSQPDSTTSLLFLEQHVNLDLDDDGYAEPYIITLEKTSKCVVRIVTRFDEDAAIERVAGGKYKGKILKIKANEFFTKKSFIPSPDGGIYDIGFGVFLGPLNEAVSSLVNMLLDAGTLQTTAGGFLGRGAKIRSGVNTFSPFEWKRVDGTGDDIRKNILPLMVNAPSDVLFQLLSLLIQYTSRISGTTDITVGENPGQNTPAQTSQTMVEMGQKIYTAIFKRIWRSSKQEFQKLFELNRIHMSLTRPQMGVTQRDYLEAQNEICPQADPNITSETQKVQHAMLLKQLAASTPGYDKDAVERRLLSALGIDDIEKIFPGGGQPAPDPLIQATQMKVEGDLKKAQMVEGTKQQMLQLKGMEFQQAQQEFVAELQETQRLNNAKIMELQAKAAESAANAQSEQAYAQVALVNAQIASVKHENDQLNTQIEHMLNVMELASKNRLELLKIKKSNAKSE